MWVAVKKGTKDSASCVSVWVAVKILVSLMLRVCTCVDGSKAKVSKIAASCVGTCGWHVNLDQAAR